MSYPFPVPVSLLAYLRSRPKCIYCEGGVDETVPYLCEPCARFCDVLEVPKRDAHGVRINAKGWILVRRMP